MMQNLEVLTEQQVREMFPGASEAGFQTREMKALLAVVDAVAEAIKGFTETSSMKGVPSGELYMHLNSIGLNIGLYQSIIGILMKAKLVKNEGHFLTWIG
jgi:hypothetical protein